jgi:hypothetical protein
MRCSMAFELGSITCDGSSADAHGPVAAWGVRDDNGLERQALHAWFVNL